MNFKSIMITAVGSLITANLAFAGAPMFTLKPLTATKFTLSANRTATVQYSITNQSSRPHTIMLNNNVAGLSQVPTTGPGACASATTLAQGKSCNMTILIDAAKFSNNISVSPSVCQRGPDGKPSPFLCYQTSPDSSLNIKLVNTPFMYVVGKNGKVYYSFDNGASWPETLSTPEISSPLNAICASKSTLYVGNNAGNVYYSNNNGANWTKATPPDGSSVYAIFELHGVLYAGTDNGNIAISSNNGQSWTYTTKPDGSAINAVFLKSYLEIYAGTVNGNVRYSNNGGVSWSAVNGSPDSTPVVSLSLANNTLYVSTFNNFTYSSAQGTGLWNFIAQSTYVIFATTTGDKIYAATANGYVYSLFDGENLGFVDFTQLNSIFVWN